MRLYQRIAQGVALLSALLLTVGSFAVIYPFGSRAGLYLADRNLGLAALLVALIFLRWSRPLGAVLLATAAMHLVDGMGDLVLQNLPAAIGSIVVAVASAVAAWLLLQVPSPERSGHLDRTTQ
jgi:hypothetical protein